MHTEQLTEQMRDEFAKVIVGQKDVIDRVLLCYFAGGHALFEGLPGLAKTLLVRTMAIILGRDFKRIQFTPDLLPADVVGSYVFNQKELSFELRKGPVFTDLLLADEINRTPPKTQAALLEVMQERQVTIDGNTHKLGDDFTVFATQNPLEFEGTFPLPEAQLDRFMMKIVFDYPSLDEEVTILKNYHEGFDAQELEETELNQVCGEDELKRAQEEIDQTTVEPSVLEFAAKVVKETRNQQGIEVGASPRASVHLLKAAKAWSAMQGRDFVTPDSILEIAVPVMRHRVVLSAEAEIDGADSTELIRRAMQRVEVPR